jgi:hypothetical protein
MATVTVPVRTTIKDKRLPTASRHLSMDSNLLNTANILLLASKNIVIRLSQVTSRLLNQVTSNLPTAVTKVVTTHSLITVPTTRPINNTHMTARRSSTAPLTTPAKAMQVATTHRHSTSTSNTVEVTTANSSTLHSQLTDPRVLQATTRATARILTSNNNTATPTHNMAVHNTVPQPQALTAVLPNPAPKTAASWALSPAAPQAVSPGTK